MTLQPTANRGEVLARSGVRGYNVDYFGSIPDDHSTTTTGGASVSATSVGTECDAGTTGGDDLTVTGGGYGGSSTDNPDGKFVREIVFEYNASSQSTDRIELGVKSPVNNFRGAWLDFETATFETSTAGKNDQSRSTTLPGQNDPALLRITLDYNAGETTFELVGGGVDDTWTGTKTASHAYQAVLYMSSNGGGESLTLYHERTMVLPNE